MIAPLPGWPTSAWNWRMGASSPSRTIPMWPSQAPPPRPPPPENKAISKPAARGEDAPGGTSVTRHRSRNMRSGENTGQAAQKSARPPEYTIIRRQSGSHDGWRQPPQLKQIRQSKKEAQLEERLSRRAELREQRSEAKHRRQWMMTIILIVLLIALIALARCNT